MKKALLILNSIMLLSSLNGQETKFRKNTISSEMGIWNRGLIGLSYHHNKSLKDNVTVAFGGGVGTGIGRWGVFEPTEYNLYTYTDGYIGFGKSDMKLILGVAIKFISIHSVGFDYYNGSQKPSYGTGYRRGITSNPFLGINYIGLYGFSFQLRIAPLFLTKGIQYYGSLPGMGFSFGYSF